MNKVILIGRLVRDPEIRYSNSAQPIAIAHYTLAVARSYKRNGEAEADFIDCIAFGKLAETAEKYLKKGKQLSVVGRLQIRTYEDKSGTKRKVAEIIIEEHHFIGSKSDTSGQNMQPAQPQSSQDGFYPVDENIDDADLPF